jgi:hypothetical protein
MANSLEPENAYTGLRNFVSAHVLWILGLAPFILAALKILMISGNDSEVFGFLIHDLDVVGIVLSVTLPLVPLTLFWVWFMWWDRRRLIPKLERIEYGPIFWTINGCILLAMSFIQVSYVFATIAVLLLIFVQRAKLPTKNQKLRLRFGDDFENIWRAKAI